jgi:uncharacterized protein YqeY
MTDSPIQDRLRQALRAAIKSRDPAAASALRSALAAIANAEAVPTAVTGSTPPAGGHQHIAGSAEGLGAAEAERRSLSEADVASIIQAEITDRNAAAAQYEQAGHPDRAERLLREAGTLRLALSG